MGPKRRPTQRGQATRAHNSTALEGGKIAANIRAWQARIRKHEPIDPSRHPSSSFITLRISGPRLALLRIPIAQRERQHLFPAQVERNAAVGSLVEEPAPPILDRRSLKSSPGSVAFESKSPSRASTTQTTPSEIDWQSAITSQTHTTARQHRPPSLHRQLGRTIPAIAESSGDQVLHLQFDHLSDTDMAPVRDPNNVQSSIKDVVQNLFEVQTQVHGFVPETQPLLIDKMSELAQSLAHLQKLTSPTQSPNNPIHQTRIAPEIIDYVDDGRNPDIYTRDFVELVQRGNAVINGKQQAFRDFAEIFAGALKDGIDGVAEEVDMVMGNSKSNSTQPNSSQAQAEENKSNGLSRS